MTPGSEVTAELAPLRNRVLICIKCLKCKKVVRNGILCDNCDYWHHFKCADVKEDDLPEENTVWNCPSCCNKVNMATNSNTVGCDETATMEVIISTLQEDLQQAKQDIFTLRNLLEKRDLELSKSYVSEWNLKSESRPNSDGIRPKRKENQWKHIPEKTHMKSVNINSITDFPPLQNRFEALNGLGEESETLVTRPRPIKSSINKAKVGLLKIGGRSSSINSGVCQGRKKIRVFADSHGRSIANELKLRCDLDVCCIMKPSAKFETVTGEAKVECCKLGRQDAAVIIAGTNDVASNETTGLITSLKKRIQEVGNSTNVLLFAVPHRFDLPSWSCVNLEVKKANEEMYKVSKRFNNVTCRYK